MGAGTTIGSGTTTSSPVATTSDTSPVATTSDTSPAATTSDTSPAATTEHTSPAPSAHAPPAPDAPSGRWVVGTDGSDGAARAVAWAVANAPDRAGRLELLRAWQMPAVTYCDPSVIIPPTIPGEVEHQAEVEVAEQAGSLGLPDEIEVAAPAVMGAPAAALLDRAAEADLLVVGSRGHGGFARLLLGSTSSQVATHATVPVVVVPNDHRAEGRARRIVVGVDGSANSLAALEWALHFADSGARLDVLLVWDVAPLLPGNEQFVCPESSDLGTQRLKLLCQRAVERTGRTDVKLRERYVTGSSRQVLRDAAEHADLLVTGARGHGAIGSAILGSVSTWLLHHLVTPMVVVPEPSTGG